VTKRVAFLPSGTATFIEPMECLSVSKLPEGSQRLWEIKLDGYRDLAVKSSSDGAHREAEISVSVLVNPKPHSQVPI